MKALFIAIVMTYTVVTSCFSQQNPPNLLGLTEAQVRVKLDSLGIESFKKEYTETGIPILQCIIKFSLQSKINATGSSMFGAIFWFGIENKCSDCVYMYASTKDLENIVEKMNNNNEYTKKANAFGWKNNTFPFEAAVEKKTDDLFSFTYRWLKKTNN